MWKRILLVCALVGAGLLILPWMYRVAEQGQTAEGGGSGVELPRVSLLPRAARAAAADYEWISEIIAEHYGAVSVQVAADSQPRIAFSGDRSLYYAHREGGAWVIDEVDRGVADEPLGETVTLKLDSNGTPHILYDDADDTYDSGLVRYATLTGSGWVTETVTIGRFPRLDLDSQGEPHITYWDKATQSIQYATKSGSGWEIQQVITGTYYAWAFPDIALDNADQPHLCVGNLNTLTYAHPNGASWESEPIETADQTVFDYCAIAVDDAGIPHVSYHKAPEGLVGYLMYGKRSGGVWQTEVVNTWGVCDQVSLALDSQGLPHIGYYQNAGAYGLYYSHYDGTAWSTEGVGTGAFITGIAIAVDQQDEPYIVSNYWGITLYKRQFIPASGTVMAHANESTPGGYVPCAGVTVTISGTEQSALTDAYGDARFTVNTGTYDIVFSKPEFITITRRDETVYQNQTIYPSALMIRQECWSAGESCYNELVNVIPIWGISSEASGFFNSLCEVTERLQHGDELGALTVMLPNILDVIDIPIAADVVDVVEGFFSCVEGLIYEALEELCGQSADACTQIFSKMLWKQISPPDFPLEVITELVPPEGKAAQAQVEALEVHLYNNSEHLGLVNGEVEHTLPTSYLFRAGGKYQVALVKNAQDDYDLELVGTEAGNYRLTIINPQSDGTGEQVTFENVPTAASSRAWLELGQGVSDYTLTIDSNGDGTPDEYREPVNIVTLGGPEIYLPLIMGGN